MPTIFIRAITPKRNVGIDPAWMKANLNKDLKGLMREVVNEFKKPVKRWSGKPDFRGDIVGAGSNLITMTVEPVGPNADKFNWIDYGTGMRLIRPKRANGFLRFQPKYRASTVPGTLMSRTAKRSGGWRSAHVVRNEIKPRGFSEQIHRKFNPIFKRRMENLIRRGLRARSP